MTEPGNFILRWARLKRASDTGHETSPSEDRPPGSLDAGVTGTEATAVQPRIDAVADEPFDLATLPSIESITADTDIRDFLQSRVPAELTRAALRQAWASDPAIRDFIGIAENQWDFNDPDAIPGFGPLPATGNVPPILAQVSNKLETIPEALPEMPVSVEQSLQAAADREPADLDRGVQRTLDGSQSPNDIRSLPDDRSGEDTASKSDRVAKRDILLRSHRSHGGALPR
jgi:Protein of unknown function (DUF3306)